MYMNERKRKIHKKGKRREKFVGRINKIMNSRLGKRQKFFLAVEIIW